MNERYYPKEQLDKDLQQIREMHISDESKIEKGNALMNLYHNQEKEWMIDHMAIVDYRENILREE
jgi:hypothetical protein